MNIHELDALLRHRLLHACDKAAAWQTTMRCKRLLENTPDDAAAEALAGRMLRILQGESLSQAA